MSGGKKTWTWRQAIMDSDLSPVTRGVLHVLACYMNDVGGGCFPSQETIARSSGYSLRSVREHLAEAEARGWIRRQEHGFRGRKWRSTEYFAIWPDREGGEIAGSTHVFEHDLSEHLVNAAKASKTSHPQHLGGRSKQGAAAGAARPGARSGSSRRGVRQQVPTNSSYNSNNPLTPNEQTQGGVQDVGVPTEHVHATVDHHLYLRCCVLTGKKPGLTDSRGGWTFPKEIVDEARGEPHP